MTATGKVTGISVIWQMCDLHKTNLNLHNESHKQSSHHKRYFEGVHSWSWLVRINVSRHLSRTCTFRLVKKTMHTFAQSVVCYVNLRFSKSSMLSQKALTFVFIITLIAEDCRIHPHLNSTPVYEDIWIKIRITARTAHAYEFVTTSRSKDHFPRMKSHPRNNHLHRVTLIQAPFFI